MTTSVDRALAPPHLDLSWWQVLRLGLLGIVSDVRERRAAAVPRTSRQVRSLRRLDPQLRSPVFVLGAPRSGTTFLGSCIGRLPTVSYHFEPRLTKATARYVYDGSWPEPKAARLFRGCYRALLLAGGDGGLRFSEKNPENCFVVPFLFRTFPNAQFVYIVRDGRDATVSHAEQPWLAARSEHSGRRGRGGTAWGPRPRFWVEPDRGDEFRSVSDVERSAWCWRRFNEAALDGLATLPAERVLTVRYEELVSDPAGSATRLAAFLEVSAGRDRTALHDALAAARTSSVGRWRQVLHDEELAAVERQCGPLLQTLGYPAEVPA